MASKELLLKIQGGFETYLRGTAALDEVFTDIRHWLNEMPDAERAAVMRDRLWPFTVETDIENGPLVGASSRNLATILAVRLWAAVGQADEVPAHIFHYVNVVKKEWHPLWAQVLHELRFSVTEYRDRFSETAFNAIADHCRIIPQSDAEQSLKDASEGLWLTIERIQYESSRPKIAKSGQKLAGASSARAKQSKYGEWTSIRSLSEGGQGRTFLVKKNGEGPLFVLKQLKNPKRLDRFRKEINAGLSLDHPNIVKVFDHQLDSEPYYLVSDFCEQGPLSKWKILSDLSLVERLGLFLQICAGVAFAHTRYIVHRDLKPDNIFIRADGSPAVGDFGICFMNDDGERLTLVDEPVGPRYYVAPELEDGRVDQVRLHSDVYSLGKLLYWLLTGREFAREKHREAAFDLTKRELIPEHFLINELLDQMIVADPSMRFKNANEVAFKVEALIERIKNGGRPVDLSAPQKCLYCAHGHYKVFAEPLYGQERKARDDAENFARLGGLGIPLWGVFVCDYCGNVQLFRPDHAKDPKVWKKS